MRILTQAGARHFCQSFSSSPSSVSVEVKRFLTSMNLSRPMREGQASFVDFRDCLLRDSERFGFMAASNFASAHRHLNAASSSWTVTSLYYSSFFSARALLAMYGGWIDGERSWIEVTDATPGSIELSHHRTRHPQLSTNDKSHRAFWKIFYGAATQLQRYAPAQHGYSLSPVQNSVSWLSDNRNRLNYGSAESFALAQDFLTRFNPRDISTSLPGDVKVFRNIAKSMLENVAAFRAYTNLSTDVNLAGYTDLTSAIAALIKANRDPQLDVYASAEIAGFTA